MYLEEFMFPQPCLCPVYKSFTDVLYYLGTCMRLQLIKVFENQFSSKIQVASRELRMPLLNVHLRGTSTETVPNTNVSGGSVVADLNGLAVKVNPIAVALNSLISSGPNPWVELRCETSCISHLLLQFWV